MPTAVHVPGGFSWTRHISRRPRVVGKVATWIWSSKYRRYILVIASAVAPYAG